MTRKYSIDKPEVIESYKANLLVSLFQVEHRNIATVNLYV